MRLLLFMFLTCIFTLCSAQSGEDIRDLFGIHKVVGSPSYSFVKYDLGGPGFEVILTFDNDLGDIWELAYNTDNKRFYTYGKAAYNTPSILLEINAATATVTNLGEISVLAGNETYSSICTTDGLTFNQTNGELIGTVDVDCGSWRGYRVVKFNLDSFGTGNVSSIQIGTLDSSLNLEYDAIAMANNNSLQGMDPDLPTNSLKFYETTNVSTLIGTTTLKNTFNSWGEYRGLAFNESENKMYSFQGQNGLTWLVICNPSYGASPYVFQNVSQYQLSGLEVRGIVFGSMLDNNLSIINNESDVLEEIELVIFPNPTIGSVEFIFEIDVEVIQIDIADASGKVVYSATSQEIHNRKLDLLFLNEGVYIFQIMYGKGRTKFAYIVKQ